MLLKKKKKGNESLPSTSNCSKFRNNSGKLGLLSRLFSPHKWLSRTWKIGCSNPVSVQRPILQPLYSHYIAIVLVIYPIISPLYPTILYPHYIPNSHVWLYSVTFSSQILVAYISHSDLFSALGDPNSHIPNPTTNSSDIKYVYIYISVCIYIYIFTYIRIYYGGCYIQLYPHYILLIPQYVLVKSPSFDS